MLRSKSSPAQLEDHLGYWLRRVSNEVSAAFARAIQAEGVSVAEWVALRLLHDHEKQTLGSVARTTGMTRGAMSKVLDKLEAKSLAVREQNPDDDRVQWLALTRAGQRLVPRLAALADRNDDHFFSCLSANDQADLRRILQKLSRTHGLNETPVD